MPRSDSTKRSDDIARLRFRFIQGAKFFMRRPDLVGSGTYDAWVLAVVDNLGKIYLDTLEKEETEEEVFKIKEVLEDFHGSIVKLTQRDPSQVMPSVN